MADFDLDYLTSVQAALRRAQHQDDPDALPRPLQPTPTPIPALYPAPDLTLPLPHNPNQAALRRAQQQDERCGSYAEQRSGPRSWLMKVAGHMPPSFRLAEESGRLYRIVDTAPHALLPLHRPPHMPPSAASGGSRGDTRARRCATAAEPSVYPHTQLPLKTGTSGYGASSAYGASSLYPNAQLPLITGTSGYGASPYGASSHSAQGRGAEEAGQQEGQQPGRQEAARERAMPRGPMPAGGADWHVDDVQGFGGFRDRWRQWCAGS